MLYIHKLSDLNVKSAEIESVPLVRAMNLSSSFPFSEQKIASLFAEVAINEKDVVLIEHSFKLLEPTIARLSAILAAKDPVHEPVNLQRAIQSLTSLSQPLANNLDYSLAIFSMQQDFLARTAGLLNSIPGLRNNEEKSRANSEINAYFEKALRCRELAFPHLDLIHEGRTELVRDLIESFRNGYIFHVTLEEELKKATFIDIKPRIPVEKLAESDEIASAIREIQEGVDHAYSINMRMAQWAVIFYSCIKFAASKKL